MLRMAGMALRASLSLDEDVLSAVRELAAWERKTIGEVISALARQAMQPASAQAKTRSGALLLPVRPEAKTVTLEMVNKLRDELPG
jgi:hypothetical protein